MSVPSSELGTPLPRTRVCLPPWTQKGGATLAFAGEGVGGPDSDEGEDTGDLNTWWKEALKYRHQK